MSALSPLHDAAIDWTRFDVVLLRSTWDYTQRLAEFLDWIGRTETQTRLLNPLEVVRWNTDKHYLCDLEKAGVAIVPSAFIEPGENATARLNEFLQTHGSISPHPPSAPSPAGGGREEFEVPAPARAGGGREGDKFVQVRGSASLHPPSTPSCAGEGREAFEFSAPDPAGGGRQEVEVPACSRANDRREAFEFVVKPAIGAGSRDAQRFAHAILRRAS